MKKFILCMAMIGFTSLQTNRLDADVVLYIDAGVNSTYQNWATGNYTAGTEFTVSGAPISVDHIGYLDAEGDGLVDDHQVGIWRVSDEALLASVFVTPTTSTTQLSEQGTGVWYLEELGTDLLLGPGTYRIAGHAGFDQNTWSNDKIGNGVTLTSGYVRTTFPSSFAYPNLSFSSEGIRTTMGYSVVPEPTGLGLVAVIGGLTLLRRRRRG